MRLGEEHRFSVFLVVFPFGEQLRQDYLEKDRAYVTKPQRKMKEICERLHLPCLDLFDEIEPGRDLIEDRIHLTAEGRGRVAELIARFLEEQSLLPVSGATVP